jgi:hypothetical protein
VDQEFEQDNALQPEEPVSEDASQEAPQVQPLAKKRDPWKAAFVVLVGVVLLSAVLIYSTSSRRTEPVTVLQTDVNGQPVQPLSPASGVEEERLAALPADAYSANSNTSLPGQLPGGDGYNPWANGGKPPPGAPAGPGGGYVTVPGGNSPFMPPEGNTVLYTKDAAGRCLRIPSYEVIPCPDSTTSPAGKPTPRPSVSPTPAGAATPKATPTPASAKPSSTPRVRNTPNAARTPEVE